MAPTSIDLSSILLTVLVTIILLLVEKKNFVGVAIFSLTCFGYVLTFLESLVYHKKLENREKYIKAYFEQINPMWSARKMEWMVGTFGAYLALVFVAESKKRVDRATVSPVRGESTVGRSMVVQGGDVEQKSVLAKPAPPMGSVDVVASRIPMQPVGMHQMAAKRVSRCNQVSHEVFGNGSLHSGESRGGIGNNIVVL